MHVSSLNVHPVKSTAIRSVATPELRLDDWIAEGAVERGEERPPPPVPMQRLRPNVVVDGDMMAFAEDGWHRIRIGATQLRVAKP